MSAVDNHKFKCLLRNLIAHLLIRRILIIMVSLTLITCGDDEVATRSYPVIDTKAVTEINVEGANLNAEILNAGNTGINDHGFIYDDVPNPTLDRSDRISLGEAAQKGTFSSLANRNLVKDKRYYVKAYAIAKGNNLVVYGKEVEFISLGGSAPEIEDFVPKQGVIGDTVLIVGTGFSNIQTNNIVSFAALQSQVVKATSDSLWCIVPANAPPGENELALKLGQFTVKPETKFFLRPLSLTSFTPMSVSFGDTITISGLNFPKPQSLITATLLEEQATIINNSSTQLRILVPNNVVVPKSSIIVRAGVQSVNSTGEIDLLKPVITNFTPSKGTKETEVIISGNYFSPIKENNRIEINGITLTVIEASKTTLKAKIPSGIVPGHYDISITVATQNVVSTSQIEIIKPLITNVNPINGTWGNTVTISGENFGNSINDNIVKFDNVQATIISASPSEIKVLIPNNLLKKNSTLSVQAITIDNLSSEYGTPFILNSPTITSFTPDEGKSKSQVTVYGENFNPIANNQIVMFGDRTVEVLSATSNQLVVKLPTSLIDSDVYIKVNVAEQTANSSSTFHLISPWRKLEDFPGNPRADAVSFSIGVSGYICVGTKPSLFESAKSYKYSPTTNSWTPFPDFSSFGFGGTASFVNLTSFVIGDEAFVGLGSLGGVPQAPLNRFSKYSASNNLWYDATDLGVDYKDGIEGAVGYSIGGFGYITSGRNSSDQPDFKVMQYDPVNDVWNRKADFQGPPRIEATGFTIGNKAYLTTGRNYPYAGPLYNDLWEYDATQNVWNQRASIPGSARWQSSAFSINNMGYLIGGASAYDVYYNLLNDLWTYNPNSDSWTRLEDFPGEPRAGATVFVIGDKAYFGTGLGNPSGLLKDFWEFDPSKL